MFVAMGTADGRLRPAGSSTVLSSRPASRSAAVSARQLEPTTKIGGDGVRTQDVDLRPNPIADAIAAAQAHTAEATQPERTVMSGTTDKIILDHLANGPHDWAGMFHVDFGHVARYRVAR
jgi:hypothetical protein